MLMLLKKINDPSSDVLCINNALKMVMYLYRERFHVRDINDIYRIYMFFTISHSKDNVLKTSFFACRMIRMTNISILSHKQECHTKRVS